MNKLFFDIIKDHGHEIVRRGNTNFIRCPFHDDPNASMSITDADGGKWYCHGGCGGGGVIAFLTKMGYTRQEAVVKWKDGEYKTNVGTFHPPLAKAKDKINLSKPKGYYELRRPAKLSDFTTKYGLTTETIKRYGLHVDDCGLCIPLTKDRVKHHKGFQTSGRAILYPECLVRHLIFPLGSIVITEGELKALILLQNKIAAISGTGGASTWHPEWSEHVYGQKVIFAYDNDAPGQAGQAKAAAMLKGIAASVRLLIWPSDWVFGDKAKRT
jgi:DNA primase (bacterial type)